MQDPCRSARPLTCRTSPPTPHPDAPARSPCRSHTAEPASAPTGRARPHPDTPPDTSRTTRAPSHQNRLPRASRHARTPAHWDYEDCPTPCKPSNANRQAKYIELSSIQLVSWSRPSQVGILDILLPDTPVVDR